MIFRSEKAVYNVRQIHDERSLNHSESMTTLRLSERFSFSAEAASIEKQHFSYWYAVVPIKFSFINEQLRYSCMMNLHSPRTITQTPKSLSILLCRCDMQWSSRGEKFEFDWIAHKCECYRSTWKCYANNKNKRNGLGDMEVWDGANTKKCGNK